MGSPKKNKFKPGGLSFRPVIADMCMHKGDPVHHGIRAVRISQDDIDRGWTQHTAGAYSWCEPLRTLTAAKRIAQSKNRKDRWYGVKRVRDALAFLSRYWNEPAYYNSYQEAWISPVQFPEGYKEPLFKLNETVFYVKVVHDPYLQLYYGRGVVTGMQWVYGDDAKHPSDNANPGENHWSYRVDFRRRCNKVDREHDSKLNPSSWVPDLEYVIEREMFRTQDEALTVLEEYKNEFISRWHNIEERIENVRTRDMRGGEEIG